MPKFLRISLLCLIIALGAFFRFVNLNWDEFHMYHPDERNIASAVTRLDLPDKLDPQFHAYNGFFIYLTRFFAQSIATITNDKIWTSDWGHISLVARHLSATFSTLTIPLFFFLLSAFFAPPLALLGAALLAFSPGLIQYAHYGVTESLLLFWFATLSLLCLKTFHQPKLLINWFYLAAVSGLSLATKTSSAFFLLMPFTVWLLTFSKDSLPRHFLYGFYFLLHLALITFIFTPYSFIDYQSFRSSMNYEGGVVSGTLQVPYNLQFQGTPSYLFSFFNLFWQINPFVIVLGALGSLLLLYQAFRYKKYRLLLPVLVFSFAYFSYVGYWYTKFIRYMIPVIPIFILGFVALVSSLHQRLKSAAFLLVAGALLTALFYTLSYSSIFLTPHTRLAASAWIYQNLPPKSVILHEHWDDRLPTDTAGAANRFEYEEVKSYDSDDRKKLNSLAAQLDAGDYYIISSKRVYGSIIHAPTRYPMMSRFYQLLFSNSLGYRLTNTFSSYPRLGSLVINDDSAEETFQVYDHPVVYVFTKEKNFNKQALITALSDYVR